MNEGDELQRQIADIGSRYLKRTLGELEQLRALLGQARSGSTESLRELSHMAHKVHGSGAMFGFDSVSECAYEIERLAISDTPTIESLEAKLSALEDEVRKQARLRGME